MIRTFMIAKIHGAVITGANLDYSGSLTLDSRIMDRAGMLGQERVQVLNMETGARIETYLIRGRAGSGIAAANGAAAHLFKKGQRVLVVAYGLCDEQEARRRKSTVLVMKKGPGNRVARVLRRTLGK